MQYWYGRPSESFFIDYFSGKSYIPVIEKDEVKENYVKICQVALQNPMQYVRLRARADDGKIIIDDVESKELATYSGKVYSKYIRDEKDKFWEVEFLTPDGGKWSPESCYKRYLPERQKWEDAYFKHVKLVASIGSSFLGNCLTVWSYEIV